MKVLWRHNISLLLGSPSRVSLISRLFAGKAADSGNLKPFSDIPGPCGILGIGSFYEYFSLIGKYSWDELHLTGLKKYNKYGPIVRERLFPGVTLLHLYRPEDIALLLDDKNLKSYPQRRSHLALKKYRDDRPHVYQSGGLLPTNGPEWWRLRSELQKGLSSPKHVRSFLPDVDAVTKDFVDKIQTNFAIDALPEISRLNLELIGLLVFDERMRSFSDSERKQNSRTSRLLEATQVSNSCILPTDRNFLWHIYETPMYKKLKNAQLYIESLAIEFVTEKQNKLKSITKHTEFSRQRGSILEEYLRNSSLSTSDIIGMASDLLLAGVETTTFTTCFIIYHLAKNAEIQEKLYKEACSVLPDVNDAITSEILNTKIPYTRAVLKESLRLNPISIGVGRILNEDKLFSDYLAPKGTIVVTQNMVACRLESNFENPLKFSPERWLEKSQKKNPYLVLPFGHGMRACIARRLAEQNILVFMLRIIRNYSLVWKGVENLGVKTFLINNPDHPVILEFHRRY